MNQTRPDIPVEDVEKKVLYFKPLCHSNKDLETSNKERPNTGNTEHLTGRWVM